MAAYDVFDVDVELSQVADLTDQATMGLLGVNESLLTGTDWTICQRLAMALRDREFEALLTWSAVDRGRKNLIVFRDRLLQSSRLTVR